MLEDFCANSVFRLTGMKVGTGWVHGNFRIGGHPPRMQSASGFHLHASDFLDPE
jgi:hypothetical protein